MQLPKIFRASRFHVAAAPAGGSLGVNEAQLASDLLEVIAQDDLYDAILDPEAKKICAAKPNQIEQAMKKTRYFIRAHDERFCGRRSTGPVRPSAITTLGHLQPRLPSFWKSSYAIKWRHHD